MKNTTGYYAGASAIVLLTLDFSATAMPVADLSASQTGNRLVQRVHAGHYAVAQVSGVINGIDPVQRKIAVSHGPVKTFGWPAMTTDFVVDPSIDMATLKSGMKIDFSVQKAEDGPSMVKAIAPATDH